MFQLKSSRFLKIGLLACLCFGFPVYAQQVLLDRPILEKVSVDPQTGDITIVWNMETPPKSPYDIEEFVLFWHETYPSSTNHPFDTIPNPSARSYTFDYDVMAQKYPNMPDPRKTSVPFSVGAENRTLGLKSLRSYEDYNVQVTSKYDSCRAEIRLNWHPYKGWESNTTPNIPLDSYRVMLISESGGPDEIIKTLDRDTFLIVTNVDENKKYSFYIEARQKDGRMISTSYQTTIETAMPIHPSEVIAEGTRYNSDGLAEISFKLDPAAETYSYEFSGSSNGLTFISLGAYNIHNDTTLTDIQIREQTHYYKLEAWHVCKNRYTASSNTATALWLKLKQEGQVNLLQWDPYQDWGGDVRYELHRQIGDEPEEIFYPAIYRDDLSGVEISGDVCYWLTARPASPTSSGQMAISNTVCIKPESDIYIPKAFTPNGDGLNDEWKPFFSYPPQNYLLILTDRIGAKVFETKNPEEAWNGQLMNGKPASEGVYVYFLRFETAMGRIVEKRGTFSLILP